MLHRRRRHRNTGKDIDTGLDVDINNNRQETWGRTDYIYISGGPLSALTCCVNVRLLSGDKKNIAVNLFSKLGWELGLYYASYDDFHHDILARMYT